MAKMAVIYKGDGECEFCAGKSNILRVILGELGKNYCLDCLKLEWWYKTLLDAVAYLYIVVELIEEGQDPIGWKGG